MILHLAEHDPLRLQPADVTAIFEKCESKERKKKMPANRIACVKTQELTEFVED